VYKPDLNEIARHVKSDRCFIHIRDAALAPGRSVKIVVQLQIKTAHEPDEAPENAPPSTVVTTPNRAGALISPPASYLSFLVRRRLLVPFSLSRRYSCCSRCFQAAWEIVGFSVHRKNLEDRILTN
jgi:hypothetical protein